MPYTVLYESPDSETLYAVESISASFPRPHVHRTIRFWSETPEEARASVKQHLSYDEREWVKVDGDLVWYCITPPSPGGVHCRVECVRVIKVDVPRQVCVREEEAQ